MNESVQAQYEVRVGMLAPYLQSCSDPALKGRAESLIDQVRQLAEASTDAAGFEAALCAGPLNAEYGLVYGELMQSCNGAPSASEVASATFKGMADHKGELIAEGAKTFTSGVVRESYWSMKDAVLQETKDDYLQAKSDMRDDPVYGAAETAGNILGILKGFFRKK